MYVQSGWLGEPRPAWAAPATSEAPWPQVAPSPSARDAERVQAPGQATPGLPGPGSPPPGLELSSDVSLLGEGGFALPAGVGQFESSRPLFVPTKAFPICTPDCSTASGGSTPPSLRSAEFEEPEPQAPPPGLAALTKAPPSAAAPAVVQWQGLEDGEEWVAWTMDARKLDTDDKQCVSPEFSVDLAGVGPTPFKLTIFPVARTDTKRGSGFRSAKGKGRIELKCCGALDAAMRLRLSIGIGSGATAQPMRGPVVHDFAHRSCCGLESRDEQWKLRDALDDSQRNLVVRLCVATSQS
uniref:Uncharacterized protein n=2 Tax=Zooxanthella nutricula TaxID=1333877 RepID=A0A7S2L3I8_9DINO|mmetsp:Transcript_55273/g.168044  ORF Transcript_55273/g.168044 Transcript_55273/m.168044 type:complete len:297 (+) Transcript_55273:2-892(+)